MMRIPASKLALALLAFAVVATGSALRAGEVLTFDDLLGSGNVPNGYGGFDWYNLYYLDGLTYGANNGYTYGVVSPPNVGYNGYADYGDFTSASPFTLTSMYLASAWDGTQTIIIDGLDQFGNVIASDTLVVSEYSPTLETFNWSGIYGVGFDSDGGDQIVVDNIAINGGVGSVPDAASTATLLGAAAFGLGLLRRKRS